MAGQQTEFSHYRYSTRSGRIVQGDGQCVNNTTSSGHKYVSNEYGDSDYTQLFQSTYGTYYSAHIEKWTTANNGIKYRNHNAFYIRDSLTAKGFSLNAICGICGNMQNESAMNPGVYEAWHKRPFPYVNWGLGLVQWTPNVKYNDWCKANGDLHIYDIESQCKRIDWEADHNAQYGRDEDPLPRSWGYTDVPTFREFKTSNLDPYTLGVNFFWYYEKPNNDLKNAKARGENANKYYQLFGGQPGPDPGPEPPTPTTTIPIWLLMKWHRDNRKR